MTEQWLSGQRQNAKEQADKVAAAVLETLKATRRSYYDQMPEKFQPHVDRLVSAHHGAYMDRYPDKFDFQEAMAANWQAKYNAFNKLAQAHGFGEAVPHIQEIPAYNDSLVACMTANVSYVLLGSGAFSSDGPGASLDYSRLPLREQHDVSDIVLPSGARLTSLPRLHEPMGIRYISGFRSGRLITSPLLAVYRRESSPDAAKTLQNFKRTIVFSSRVIDIHTGFSK